MRRETYGGTTVDLEVDQVGASGAWVLVAQLVDAPEAHWYAWLPAGAVRPIARKAP